VLHTALNLQLTLHLDGSRATARSDHPSRATTHSDHPSRAEPSRASGRARSRASTRQSTIHPDDSVSNGGYRQHRPRESDSRGRSRAPTNDRRQLPLDRPSNSGYTSASRRRESDTRDRSMAPANNRSQVPTNDRRYPPIMPAESGYSSSSRSVAHPHARQDLNPTYTYQPAGEHRSRRSRVPSLDSRAVSGAHRSSNSSRPASTRTTAGSRYSNYDETGSGAHRSSASSRAVPARTTAGSRYDQFLTGARRPSGNGYAPCERHAYLPPPPPVLRGRSGRYMSSISALMNAAEVYDSDEEFEYMQTRMSGL
jgi:hypothetical protein